MKIKKGTKAFTLIELMVTVGIFAMMTAVLIAKYGTFDQGVLLTNLAYDVALNIRSAQSYGLNAKGDSSGQFTSITYTTTFQQGATNFSLTGGGLNVVTQIKRGSSIQSVCAGSDPNHCTGTPTLTVSFRRPDPSADINTGNAYGEIVVRSSQGTTKTVVVRSTGQISVK